MSDVQMVSVAFARYDANGQYTSTGVVPANSITLSEPGIYIGVVDALNQYHTPDGPVDKPPRPSPIHVFDYVLKAWVDPRTLDDLKAAQWEEMKVLRQAAMDAPLVTPYGTFDADPVSRQFIVNTAQLVQTAAQSLSPGDEPLEDFTLADNSVVTLTAGQMVQVALMLASQIKTAFNTGREVRIAIAAATTPEEVAAVTWSTTP